MEIVINIPESVYKEICSGNFDTDGYFKRNLRDAFRNGTVLPKGYGNLIDVSQLMTITDIRADGNEVSYVPYSEIEDAPIIIKADKE